VLVKAQLEGAYFLDEYRRVEEWRVFEEVREFED
jgi:hypothetical protein